MAPAALAFARYGECAALLISYNYLAGGSASFFTKSHSCVAGFLFSLTAAYAIIGLTFGHSGINGNSAPFGTFSTRNNSRTKCHR